MSIDSMGGLDMQALIDTFPYYVLVVDEDHVIHMANNAVRRMLKVNPEDLIGKSCPEAVHDMNGPFPGCPLEEAIEKNDDVEKEIVDEQSGQRFLSCIYDTGFTTEDGKKLYLHTTRSSAQGDDMH